MLAIDFSSSYSCFQTFVFTIIFLLDEHDYPKKTGVPILLLLAKIPIHCTVLSHFFMSSNKDWRMAFFWITRTEPMQILIPQILEK